MWIMTSFGVFAPALRKPGTVSPGDTRDMQIRARDGRHLEALRALYMPGTLGPTIRGAGTDYEYRALCTREAWADALARMALDTDYHSFKDTTKRFPATDAQLHGLYLAMWSLILNRLGTFSPWLRRVARTPVQTRHTPRTEVIETTVTRTVDTMYDGFGSFLHVGDEGFEIDWNADDEEFERIIDEQLSRPVRRKSGQLDHSDCSHAQTNNARRRCRRRFEQRRKGK